MKTLLTMLLEGVILYVFISNFAVTLMALKIVANVSMLSGAAIGAALLLSALMSIMFATFSVWISRRIKRTGFVPFPFVLANLSEDYYSDETQEDRRRMKEILNLEVDEIMEALDLDEIEPEEEDIEEIK